MITEAALIPIVPLHDQEQLLHNVGKNDKYKLIVLLMLDCGLRVSEVCRLQIKHLNFSDQLVMLPSLKKRSEKPVYRTIPMTKRVLEALSNYYIRVSDKSPGAWLFPSKSSVTGYLSRKSVWKMLKKKSSYTIHPHMLRHTYGTTLAAQGNNIGTIKDLMGHNDQRTTEIYLHVPLEKKRAAVKTIDKRSWPERIKDRFFPKKHVFHVSQESGLTGTHVGRREELKKIADLSHKKVNTIIIGPQGIGKSHLLHQFKQEKTLWLDDFKGIKTTLGNVLLMLFEGDKEKVIGLLTEYSDIHKVITKNSVPNLINLLIQSTDKNEYTLIIDDLTNVTAAGVTALDKLKNHFHLIAAARQIKIAHASFLSNFQKVELGPLNRAECLKLISGLSKGFRHRIEDYETFKNHIIEQVNGNPLFLYELVERFSKEPVVTIEHVREIRHTAALKDIDMSIPLVVVLSSFMILRYVGGEFDTDGGAYKLFGGAFLLFALFARPLLTFGKRKYV